MTAEPRLIQDHIVSHVRCQGQTAQVKLKKREEKKEKKGKGYNVLIIHTSMWTC